VALRAGAGRTVKERAGGDAYCFSLPLAPVPTVVREAETRHRESGGKVSRHQNSGHPWWLLPKSIAQPSPVTRQSMRRDVEGKYN